MDDPIPFVAIIALGGVIALYVTGASLVSLVTKKPRTERDGPTASQSTPSMKRNLAASTSLLITGLLLALLRSFTYIVTLLGYFRSFQLRLFSQLSTEVILYSTMVILKRQFFPWNATSPRRKCLSVVGDSALICIAGGLALTVFIMTCSV